MKSLLISLVLVCLLTFPVCSQDESSAFDSMTYRHHVGTNTELIFGSLVERTYFPFQLFYKYQLKQNKALRLQIDTRFSIKGENPPLNGGIITETRSGNGGISYGYEWQNYFSKRWAFYYGGDIRLGISGTAIEAKPNLVNSSSPNIVNSFSYSIRAKPFIGIRFNINSRLYLASEASLALTYFRSTFKNKLYNNDGTNLILISEQKSKTYDFDIEGYPFSGIYVFYLF